MAKKILVIEDDPTYQRLIKKRLNLEGYDILQAFDGEEGFKLAITENPDLILLDILLPKVNGMDVLDRLRQDKKGKLLKIIVLTNVDPDPELIQKTIEGKPNCYLVKSDTRLSELASKIKEII